MLKRYMLPMLGLALGGVCLSLTPSHRHSNANRSSYDTPQNVKPGVSDEYYESRQPREQATEREEIAYLDERDEDIHQRANRKGDWDYKENWRYDREAFYKGETQAEAYDRKHPDGIGGPGMDPDTEYLQMRKFYLEERNRRNVANQKNSAARSYANSQNNSRKTNNPNNREISSLSRPYAQPTYPSNNRNYNQNYNNNPNYNPTYNQNYHSNPNYNPNYNPNGYPNPG